MQKAFEADKVVRPAVGSVDPTSDLRPDTMPRLNENEELFSMWEGPPTRPGFCALGCGTS